MTHLGIIERRVPYPLRAMRISISFRLFPRWKPYFNAPVTLESERAHEGAVIWYAGWLFFQIEYSRWI